MHRIQEVREVQQDLLYHADQRLLARPTTNDITKSADYRGKTLGATNNRLRSRDVNETREE